MTKDRMGSNISNRISEADLPGNEFVWFDTTPPKPLVRYFDDPSLQSLLANAFSNGTVGNGSDYGEGEGSSDALTRTTGELVVGTLTFVAITLMTIGGNILVILSVLTYRPLTRVQNYFLVSLAAADLAVAVLVTPFHVVKFIVGEWIFGLVFCQIWLTADILCCTASILNLCAIALDRYWAIHDPIAYANKRTLRLVLCMIAVVWALSLLISVPPLIGWNDWSKEHLKTTCELTTHREFVVFSACGSFFIPLFVMATVYAKIFLAARQRLRSKRRSIRGLSVGSMAESEPGDRPEQQQVRANSRRSRRRPASAMAIGSGMGVGRNSASGVTICSSGADYSMFTGPSTTTTTTTTTTTCYEEGGKIPILTRRNTGLCTVIEQNCSSTGGEPGNNFLGLSFATTPVGNEPSPNATPANEHVPSEKAFLLKKEQNGAATLFVVTPADGNSFFRPDFDMDIPKPRRQQSLHRFVSRLSQRASSRSAASRRSEPYVLGLPRRDDSVRTSISSHIAVEKYIKEKERISVTKEKKAAKTLAVIMGKSSGGFSIPNPCNSTRFRRLRPMLATFLCHLRCQTIYTANALAHAS